MLLSYILRWFTGWVRVEAEGGYPERLLNAVAAENITVWGVRCRGPWMRFSCFAREYHRLRHPARRACLRLRVRQKHGLPFWLFRYRHRKGLAVGLAIYALVLALLTPRIWVIQVVGNDETPAADILAVAARAGVCIGNRMDALDRKQLETTGVDFLPTLGWISVNPSGCVARVEVAERKPTPQVLDLSQPSDMVALRDGRIEAITVVNGQRLVMVGEAVSAGTVLITGRVASEAGEHLTRAYGEVWARTQRRITVSVPLTYYPPTPSGFVAVCPTLSFLGWEMPLYSHTPSGDGYVIQERAHFLQASGKVLPLGVTNRYYIRLRREVHTRTQSQAAALAERRLAAQQAALFAPDSFEAVARDAVVRDGVYTLTVTYSCRENIAQEEPLAQ